MTLKKKPLIWHLHATRAFKTDDKSTLPPWHLVSWHTITGFECNPSPTFEGAGSRRGWRMGREVANRREISNQVRCSLDSAGEIRQ